VKAKAAHGADVKEGDATMLPWKPMPGPKIALN